MNYVIAAVEFLKFFMIFMKIQIWLLTVAQGFIWIAEGRRVSDFARQLNPSSVWSWWLDSFRFHCHQVSICWFVGPGTAISKHWHYWQLMTVHVRPTFSFGICSAFQTRWSLRSFQPTDSVIISVQSQSHNSTKKNLDSTLNPQCSQNDRGT